MRYWIQSGAGYRPGRKFRSRSITRSIRTAIVATLVAAFAGTDAPGYRFSGQNAEGGLPVAAEAVRWDRSVWGPGETLTWVVTDDPAWTREWTDSEGAKREPPFASPDEVIPFVSEALGAWSDIDTADIRWEVSGVDPTVDRTGWGDRRPTIFVDPGANRGSYARGRFERSAGGEWELVDCDVPLAPFAAAALATNPWWTFVLIHEFGHCLGLHHAGAYPRVTDAPQQNLRGVFGKDPLMSYGAYFDDLVSLTPDDRLGASLLRPAPGWESSTGAITGVVTANGGPAPYVQVFAIPVSGGIAAGVVGSFTNHEGEFAIAGLAPGRYVLWAGPLNVLYAHGGLLGQQPPPLLGAAEHARLLPVSVAPGAVTDGVQIALRAAREG